MKVLLRNPRRELEVAGPISVIALLNRLDLNRESVLVIKGDDPIVEADRKVRDLKVISARPGQPFQVVAQVVTEQPGRAALEWRQARQRQR